MDLDELQDKALNQAGESASRKKLWQLDPPFLCSVIGTCLTLAELKRLSRKMRLPVHGAYTDYDLHRCFVDISSRQTHASRYLHKYLDQKYRDTIRAVAKAGDGAGNGAARENLWNEAVASGVVDGPFWALVTQPGVPVALVNRVYGEVHMLSHLAGATVRVDMQELDRLRRQTRTLARQLADMQVSARQQVKGKDSAIQQLKKRLLQSEGAVNELEAVREQLAALEADPPLRRLQQNVEEITTMLTEEQARTERAEANADMWARMAADGNTRLLKLEGLYAELQAERDALESSLDRVLASENNATANPSPCTSDINLCGRCVLYVGGRNRQCANFRALVERQNGQFIHHDGGLEDSSARLGSILPQADVVLCPLDCVSHDAAKRVKQFCKRHGKRYVFLPRSSLAAFARGLNEQAA